MLVTISDTLTDVSICVIIKEKEDIMVTRTVLTPYIAWAAGLIDGEGWVGWMKGVWGKSAGIRVVNTEKELLDELVSIFGVGSIHPRTKDSNPNRKQAWVWSVYGRKALTVSSLVQPLIHSPSKQARIQDIISFYNGKLTPT